MVVVRPSIERFLYNAGTLCISGMICDAAVFGTKPNHPYSREIVGDPFCHLTISSENTLTHILRVDKNPVIVHKYVINVQILMELLHYNGMIVLYNHKSFR